ncbi:hypothetical protein [Streptomyces sp. HUAS ZL42]|uniref:hypothetical protein n=1 Tax=Streptomyces sp. HUAS ZL42 TaxID=3231715 RepID=UPI00345E0824
MKAVSSLVACLGGGLMVSAPSGAVQDVFAVAGGGRQNEAAQEAYEFRAGRRDELGGPRAAVVLGVMACRVSAGTAAAVRENGTVVGLVCVFQVGGGIEAAVSQ